MESSVEVKYRYHAARSSIPPWAPPPAGSWFRPIIHRHFPSDEIDAASHGVFRGSQISVSRRTEQHPAMGTPAGRVVVPSHYSPALPISRAGKLATHLTCQSLFFQGSV